MLKERASDDVGPALVAPELKQLRLLQRLNVFGLCHLDAVLLAALADGEPLLLIGPHGTAKSALLNRIAAALGLEHRHYNASLIAFDDLLGYPVPNASRTGVEYLRTPGDLWDAESVFLDEISRCRPEHQNKLFSIVHERRVQGLPLTRLRYRWAAMNPAISLDGEDDVEDGGSEHYHGSLPLDPALADRFAYVVEVPTYNDLDAEARLGLLTRGGLEPEFPELAELVERTRVWRAALAETIEPWVLGYVTALTPELRAADLPVSGRRALLLKNMIASVFAAAEVLGTAEL